MGIIASAMLLNEETYWDIVARSLVGASDDQSQLDNLISILQEYPNNTILQFDLRTEELLFRAHTNELWCAATIMNKNFVSDDSFIYFKTWLISRGKEVYYNALENPDSLTEQIKPQIKWYEFEEFRYAASSAFEKSTGENLHYYYPKDFAYAESQYPVLDFYWQTESARDMRAVCPKLFDAMYKTARKVSSPKSSPKKRR